jgi:hypothetical protein
VLFRSSIIHTTRASTHAPVTHPPSRPKPTRHRARHPPRGHTKLPARARITAFFPRLSASTSPSSPPRSRSAPPSTTLLPPTSSPTPPTRLLPSPLLLLQRTSPAYFSSIGWGITPHPSDERWLSTLYSSPKDLIQLTFQGDRQYWPHLTSDLLHILSPTGWLNDTCISNTSTLLSSLSPPPPHTHSFLCLSPHLYPTLFPRGTFLRNHSLPWFRVDSQGRCLNPLLYNLLSIPINDNNTHWVGIFVDLLAHTITYRDSLGHQDASRTQNIQSFLNDELAWRLQRYLTDPTDPTGISPARAALLGNPLQWTCLFNPSPNPLQSNGNDCGVYYLANMWAHIPMLTLLPFEPHDTPLLRIQLTLALRHHNAALTPVINLLNPPLLPTDSHDAHPFPMLDPYHLDAQHPTRVALFTYSSLYWIPLLPLVSHHTHPPPREGIG